MKYLDTEQNRMESYHIQRTNIYNMGNINNMLHFQIGPVRTAECQFNKFLVDQWCYVGGGIRYLIKVSIKWGQKRSK